MNPYDYSFLHIAPHKTHNKVVACSPFPKQNIEKVIKGGIAMIDKKVNLQELTVIFHSSDGALTPGMKVHIRGDAVVQPWAKEIFALEGKEFILVPESVVMVISRG